MYRKLLNIPASILADMLLAMDRIGEFNSSSYIREAIRARNENILNAFRVIDDGRRERLYDPEAK